MAKPVTYAAILEMEPGCPVCGSRRYLFDAFGPAKLSAKARYDCGSSFSTYENHEIKPDLPCRRPGMVASDALNRKVRELRGSDG